MKRIMQIVAMLVLVSATNGYGWEWPWNWGGQQKRNISSVKEYYYPSKDYPERMEPLEYERSYGGYAPEKIEIERVIYPTERTWLEKMRHRSAQYRKEQPKEAVVTGQKSAATLTIQRTIIEPSSRGGVIGGSTYRILPSGEEVLERTTPSSYSKPALYIRRGASLGGVSKPLYRNPGAFSKEAQQQYQWAKDRE